MPVRPLINLAVIIAWTKMGKNEINSISGNLWGKFPHSKDVVPISYYWLIE